jgi:hypothetical protein
MGVGTQVRDCKPATDVKWQPLKVITTLPKLWERRHKSADTILHVRVRLPSARAAAAAATPAA